MSSTVIFYFSGTGNSRYVAQRLAELLEGEAVNLVGFEGEVNADRVGFVTACYCNDIPKKAYELIRELKIKRADYLFDVTTSQASDGFSALSVDKLLRDKGYRLNLAEHVGMLSTFVITVAPIVRKTEGFYISREDAAIKKIAENVKNAAEKPAACAGYPVKKVINKLCYFGLDKILRVTKKSVNDRCIGCGKCVELCPCNNISIKNGKAVFKDDCTYCYGCAHICPQDAVKYGINNIKGNKKYSRFQ